MPGKIALIAGATGLVGGILVDLLKGDPFYSRVVAISRRKLAGADGEKISQVIADYESIGDNKESLKADHIFCCLGTTMKKAGSKEAFRQVDYKYPLRLAEICQAGGANQFLLVSALGADPKSNVFYSRVKGEIERDIGQLDYESYHIFRPSLILGARKEKRLGERLGKIAMTGLGFLMVGPFRKYRAVHAEAIANGMISIAKTQEPGRHIHPSDQIQGFNG